MLTKWDRRFISMAQLVSTWSKDPSTGVGAVIVRPNKTIMSIGYNGLPRGMKDDPAALADRDYKMAHTVHAEVNAIVNAPERPEGCSLYVWPLPPCSHCASIVIQSGIKRVYSPTPNPRWTQSCRAGAECLVEAGVQSIWFGTSETKEEIR